MCAWRPRRPQEGSDVLKLESQELQILTNHHVEAASGKGEGGSQGGRERESVETWWGVSIWFGLRQSYCGT